MNTIHNKRDGRFDNGKVQIGFKHMVVLILMLGIIIAVVETTKRKNKVMTVTEEQNTPEFITDDIDVQPVEDEYIKEVKKSEEFKKRVENLAKQEALLNKKDALTDEFEKVKAEYETALQDIETQLETVRTESLNLIQANEQ